MVAGQDRHVSTDDAAVVDINYTSGRKLNQELINRLATCEYITEHRNLFITGATGSRKTYMACAFGLEACKQHLLYEEYCFERKRSGLSLLFSVKILIR